MLSTSSLWSRIPVMDDWRIGSQFLKRSGDAPLDIIASPSSRASSRSLDCLVDTVSRWRSVAWHSSAVGSLLTTMHHKYHWNVQRYFASPFMALETLQLEQVSPAQLPPVMFPSLRSLQLHNFKCGPGSHRTGAQMSELCALLSRAPILAELVLDAATPALDVCLSYDDLPHSDGGPHMKRETPHEIHPIQLQKLTRLEWSFAPPKDCWAIFCFLAVPVLRELELCLNTGRTRWAQAENNRMINEPETPPVGRHRNRTITFEQLEVLSVECIDSDGLTDAFKKMHFPALKRLSIAYIPPRRQRSLLVLPRHESIFREPRMPSLTHLSLSCFELDLETTPTMLRYLPSLTHLTLNACTKAGPIVCSLSGRFCSHCRVSGAAGSGRNWVVPRLEHLGIVECADVRFACLSEVVRARRAAALDLPGGGYTANGHAAVVVGGVIYDPVSDRVMKPLKRRPIAGPSLPGTPARVAVAPTAVPSLASPSLNGSFVPGWNPHGSLKPVCVESVHVEGCLRVSEAEAMSLREEEWGVVDVVWYP
ncbi:uncharacterized protein LAESUDRAFT_522650 [Laetiporus sulphureus 93-53]|uniref:F-box domain-containing protein n=1 Tax=Laetiporus sulphureus 93-53 TaxID=1314785 RepID=A0A165BES0_9APHY|nr:uncharacterized protein LAESUDRAFT_522650 [Laetiporus sulphureus 93-53]KZT00897.1 hypothetical protein LAESUDRAFT_522650 [Laetiporus sulphureus 93-53]